MIFSEKLNYLFDLTHAEGRELASAMSVTPPQISKMRSGNRGLPRNRESAQVLADFFAQRCNNDFHKNALSQMINSSRIRNIEDEAELSDALLDWLSNDKNPEEHAAKRADAFLRKFSTLTDNDNRNNSENKRILTSERGNLVAYYGNAGKRLAVENFLSYIAQRNQPYTIDVLTDESINWLYEDTSFSALFQENMLKLTDIGCYFRRISGPIMDMDQAFESLNRWLPLYMSGKATSYYYKRMRDSLNRLTLFVVPEVAVLFSFSVGSHTRHESVTYFTTDDRTVSSMAIEFENYLSMCEPIMNVYTTGSSSKQMHACMLDYDISKSSCIQRNESLSFITLPWDIAITMRANGTPDEKNEFLTSFAQRYKYFKANLEQFLFTDMIRLADFDSIINESIVIPGTYVLGLEDQHYTTVGYLEHLRSILYLLEHQPNYHVVLRNPEDNDNVVLYVKEGYNAILALAVLPFSVFKVSEHYLVDAFTEYLKRQLPADYTDASYRQSVISKIKSLIEPIEQYLLAVTEKPDTAHEI